MFDAEEIRLLKATANELNNLLQVISESSKKLELQGDRTDESERLFAMLRNGIERATDVARLMADRMGGYRHEHLAPRPAPLNADFGQDSGGELRIVNPDGPRELVMVVDDEELVRLLAVESLAGEGYRVLAARDGFQALRHYRLLRDQIELVLLDFMMPVMDGADVFAELQQMNPDVAVVLCSGFTEQEKLRKMLAKGLRGFIPKPYTQEKFLTHIRHVLDDVRGTGSGVMND